MITKIEPSQATNAPMAVQNQEIQDRLTEVLSAAKLEVRQVEIIDLPTPRMSKRGK